jgi:hypothetical protein
MSVQEQIKIAHRIQLQENHKMSTYERQYFANKIQRADAPKPVIAADTRRCLECQYEIAGLHMLNCSQLGRAA